MQPEENSVHMVQLTDGSRFGGVLLGNDLSVTLSRGGQVTLPMGVVQRIMFAAEPDNNEPRSMLRLRGGDVVVVALAPKMQLKTVYGDLSVNGPEVKGIERVADTLDDIQVTLWGRLLIHRADRFLDFGLHCGRWHPRTGAGQHHRELHHPDSQTDGRDIEAD